MFRLSLYPVFDSYLMVAVVAILLAGLMWFGPRGTKIGPGRRTVLATIRAIVVVMVLLAMLRPTLVYTETKKQAATFVVLADQSRSMSVPDAVGGKTRFEALRGAVADAASALAKLQNDFELKAYAFDSDVQALEVKDGQIELPEKPEGQQTAIGAAIDEVLRREAGKRLLGLAILSDGAQRAYAPRDLPPQSAATRLKNLGCPLFAFPFGQSRGLGQAKDVAVNDLVVNPTVFVKNELTVNGQVRIDGFTNVEIPVRVLFETSPGKMEVVAEQNVRVEADAEGKPQPVKLDFSPQTPGEFRLTLEAAEQPGELVATNNRLSTFVQVLGGGLKVLYIEGALRVEQKFVRRALDSSPDIKTDYVRLDPRDEIGRPADFADRFQPGKYDVYILGDVGAAAFRPGELSDLEKCVTRGAGLMMLGGFQSFGAGGYADTPLKNVLPVGMDALERQQPDESVRSDLHWPGPIKMRPTAIGLMHFAMMLASDRQRNDELWKQLPPLEGANKLHDPAPGAVVLAADEQDRPLLVAQSFGEGRSMAFSVDSTWRWWMQGHEASFKRFWRQAVLWLARKDQVQEGRVWIRLVQRRFAPSQQVEFTVGATAPTGESLADATYKAEIVLPDGAKRPLSLIRREDQMSGAFRDAKTAGDYAIEVSAVQKGQPIGSARARFLVFQQDLELDNAAADAPTLESLAAMTAGQSLAPEQLSELVKRITETTAHLDIQQETKKTFWDTWPFFLTVVFLLGVEWYLRKRWGLV